MLRLRLDKWQDNVISEMIEEWMNQFRDNGIEETVEMAIAEGIEGYVLFNYTLIRALENEEREDLVSKVENATV